MPKKTDLAEFERQAFPAQYFEKAKKEFRTEYDNRARSLIAAEEAFRNLLSLLLSGSDFSTPKVTSRLKDRAECISKFDRKYRTGLEKTGAEYKIFDHISDLIGLRVICLYEDEVYKVENALRKQFHVTDRTDKSKEIEETISSFGYKGVHLDLKLMSDRSNLPEYKKFSDLKFEVQIRTIVQDGWSEIDHKIKYKRETPEFIQRRIASLAALFEMADREFQSIRDLSLDLERQVQEGTAEIQEEANLDLVGFLSVASKHYSNFPMGGEALDLLLDDIRASSRKTTTEEFRKALSENLETIYRYMDYLLLLGHGMTPYTQIRHALYKFMPSHYANLLFDGHRRNFDRWIEHGTVHPAEIG
jgi:GTP pyrophosphokinase